MPASADGLALGKVALRQALRGLQHLRHLALVQSVLRRNALKGGVALSQEAIDCPGVIPEQVEQLRKHVVCFPVLIHLPGRKPKPALRAVETQQLVLLAARIHRHPGDTQAPGEGFGLTVRVVQDALAGNIRISDGSFGWSGVYGTHFWVDPKEEIVAVMMCQTSIGPMRNEFENAVMQAIVK